MKRIVFALLTLACVFYLGMTLQTGQAMAQEKTVTIGMMGSWTGPLGPMGVVSRKGAYLAQKHINETGFDVGGQKYKLEFYDWDVRTDPKVAVAGVQKMMDEKNVKLIVGPMYSAATLACQPITQPKGIVHIVYSSATQVIRPEVTHTFRTVTDAKMRAAALSTYFRAMGIEKMVFLVENMATALSMYDNNAQAFEALGGKVLAKDVFETGTTDFFTPLVRLKAKNPDALFICANPESAGLIIKQTREVGWPVQTVAEGNPPTGPDFWKIGGEAVEGHIDLTSARGLDPGEKLVQIIEYDMALRGRFFKEFKAEYDIDPNISVGQLYYDMIHLAVEAMKRGGTVDDADKIRQAMIDMNWQGVCGRWRFFPSGQCWSWAMISEIHAGQGWTPLAIMEPAGSKMEEWKVVDLEKTPQIKDIRKKRGY